MKYDYLKLIENIKEAREEKGLSKRKLAEKVGVSHTEISKIENGLRPGFSFVVLAKICEVLEMNIEFLLEDIGLKEVEEEKEFYVLFEDVNVDIFLIYAKSEGEALRKAFEFVCSNSLIEIDIKPNGYLRIGCTDNIEKFRKKYPKEVEKFLKKLNSAIGYNGKNNEENDDDFEEDDENFDSECGDVSKENCNSCEFYCPNCGSCTFVD